MDQDVPPRRRCWALSLDTSRGNETRSSGTSMVDRHVTERLDLPIGRVTGRMGGRTRAVDGSWCSVSHRGAIWPTRSSDEAGGALAGVVGAAPSLGGGPPLERWRCSDARLVLPNPRLRLSSEHSVAISKPSSQARPDRLRRSIGRAALRMGHVVAAAVRRGSTRDRLMVLLRTCGRLDASALRRATTLLDFRLVQRAAGLELEPPGVGRTGT